MNALKVVIVGGGIGGIAAAIGLARSGHNVTVLEEKREYREIGAGIQIPPNSARVLKGWSLLDALKAKSIEPRELVFKSYRDGGTLSTTTLIPYMNDTYSAPYLLIHRADFLEVLVQEALRLQVSIRLESPVTKINFSEPSVGFGETERMIADIIIAADGEQSLCRSRLLGKPDYPLPIATGKLVYRFTVNTRDLRHDPDLLPLVDPPKITSWLGPDSSIVCYELAKSNVYNIALIKLDESKSQVHFGPRKIEIDDLKAMFESWDPIFQKLLNLAQEACFWTLFINPEVHSWVHPNGHFTLMGDAAHAMFPYLAQGASQCIEDAAVIGTLFAKAEQRDQIPDLLTIFQDLRKPRSLAIRQRAAEAGQVYEMIDGPQQELRDYHLREHAPFEDYPNPFDDPVFQKWLYEYCPVKDSVRAWNRYNRGEWPGLSSSSSSFSAKNRKVFCSPQPSRKETTA